MSSSEDNSDGAEAVLDFDKIDRIRESVSFDDCAEQLAINDYQGMNLYIYIYVYIYNMYFHFRMETRVETPWTAAQELSRLPMDKLDGRCKTRRRFIEMCYLQADTNISPMDLR